jgi:RNA polymerase sigma-54 factor
MQQGLSLRVSQHLALSPQLQQSIRLLQLSTLELEQEVGQMLDDNPFLERLQNDAERELFGVAQADTPVSQSDLESETAIYSIVNNASQSSDGSQNDDENSWVEDPMGWEGDGSVSMPADDSEWGGEAPAQGNNLSSDDDTNATEIALSPISLQKFLHTQVLHLRLSNEDHAALWFLIESLNDDGYLEGELSELASSLAGTDTHQTEQFLHHLTVALRLLQSLEPVGVGARSLAECLSLQLKAMASKASWNDTADLKVVDVALRICEQSMDFLARRDIRNLVMLCHAKDAAVRSAIALIGRLDPKPGRRFVDVERNTVVPDVLVTQTGTGSATKFKVQLNPDVMPRLRVHDVYANALKGFKAGASNESNVHALQQRLMEARWFIKNIQQRFDTILRVSNAIVERQKGFFIHGDLAMRPLVLREIADELGLHESTISRVTSAKYMATPLGTFELKYFFGSGLATECGGNASSTAVRALIKQFIEAENPNKPLSDNQVSAMLQEQGIECARRTVAKYREALRIAPASLRKAL